MMLPLAHEKPDIQRFVAERVCITAAHCVPEHEMVMSRASVDTVVDHAIRSTVLYLSSYVHGMHKETISVHRKWPKTWWDAFKARWFPTWATRRWPIEYERIDIEQKIFHAVCPHLQDRPQSTHLEWMASKTPLF